MLSWQSQNKTIITKSDEWLQIKVYLVIFASRQEDIGLKKLPEIRGLKDNVVP